MLKTRIVAQLLVIMDGMEERGNVIVIGATRHINLIEPTLRRGGRFDREIELKMPDVSERVEILKIYFRFIPLSNDVRIEDLAQQTNGFSGADLVDLSNEAVIQAI
jgi:transitional endoplasmic reticulum ATPase